MKTCSSEGFQPPRTTTLLQGHGILVLFVDQDILAVHKPERLPTIPEGTPGAIKPCLRSILESAWGEKLYVVHRLDKDASGVVIFARNPEAHRRLNDQFADRTVEKVYLALVLGDLVTEHLTIEAPLREYGSGRVGVDPVHGKESRTDINLLQHLAGHTLVEVRPRTGRRHQIRAHLYSIGHPVAGDNLYGDNEVQRRYGRLMLHGRSITVTTAGGEQLIIEAPPPPTFASVLTRLGAT